MKALTICQPYAHLICLPATDPRHKRVENRTWHCPQSVVGTRIAIHAGKSKEWLNLNLDGWMDETYEILLNEMVFSAIVATAKVAASVTLMAIRAERYKNRWPWLNDHEHTEGPICWVLEDVTPIEPIPCKGAQGLWNVPSDIEVKLLQESF